MLAAAYDYNPIATASGLFTALFSKESCENNRFPGFSGVFCPTFTDSVCIKDSVRIDPACGSGSLLLKAEKVLGKDAVRNGFYGQEINITTYNLCRINMFLHDVGFDKFSITSDFDREVKRLLEDGEGSI